MRKIIIAVDGYSSCGKSTLAKQLAKELGHVYVDSGAMYRAVTLFSIEHNFIDRDNVKKQELIDSLDDIQISFKPNAEFGFSETFLNGKNVEKEIRQMKVATHVSKISAIKEVRKKLVSLQCKIGRNGGVVMDGRDIGSVVFPDAELKIFMTADKEIRAKRRFDELYAKGESVSMEEVKKNIEERDYLDTHREESPLVQAKDAIVLDNSNLTPQQQLEVALEWAKEKILNSEF
ncbi:MAG: cytidylate kinase [Flavobacteriales bacterium]|nr:(d)CMP kinase [Bacteroidales bacterium AH-315-I05]PCJ86164.1 MAG: cytidylate kinase [Flavobacteriales bacterium]